MDNEADAETILRDNVRTLMRVHRLNQEGLATRLNLSQAWVSKRLSGKPPPQGSRFQVGDLNMLARAFGVSPVALLSPKGPWDRRRSGHDRRSGADRRHT